MKEKFAFSIASKTITQIFNILTNYFLFYFLSVKLMGIWALINSIINLGLLFNEVGFDSIHYQYSEKSNFDSYFSSFFLIKMCLIILDIFTTIILISLLNFWNNPYLLVIIVLLISNIVYSFLTIFTAHLKGKLKILLVDLTSFIVTSCLNFFKLYIIFNISVINNPLLYLALSLFLFNLINVIFVFSISRKNFIFSKIKKEYITSYIKDTKHLIIFSIILVISNNLGNLFLVYSFNLETLAQFNLVNNFILPIFAVISISLISICTPLYSQYLAQNKIEAVQKINRKIEKYVSILFLSAIISIFIIGEKFFKTFLPNYINSLPILYLMLIFIYLTGVNRGYSLIMISGKKQNLVAFLSTINVSLILFLIVILVPKYFFGLGSIGYSYAYIFPTLLISFNLRYFTYKIFGIKPNKEIIFHILIAVGLIIFSDFLKSWIITTNLFDYFFYNLLILSIFIGLFYSLLFIFGFLKKEDIVFIFQLFKLSNYRKSYKSEL